MGFKGLEGSDDPKPRARDGLTADWLMHRSSAANVASSSRWPAHPGGHPDRGARRSVRGAAADSIRADVDALAQRVGTHRDGELKAHALH